MTANAILSNSAPNTIVVIDPIKAIEDARNRRSIVVSLRERSILVEGVDFGVVPGSSKPTLLKPGAERLCSAFGLNPVFETLDKVERWDGDTPMFFYRVMSHLIHIDSGLEIATGIGSCNSMESKYRWRWCGEDEVSPQLDKSKLQTRNGAISEFDFAIDKAETSGKYGKPAAYWQQFKDAIANGSARRITRKTGSGRELPAWEIGSVSYRIPNDDIFSLVNTIDKMACKRALIASILIGANASEFFTQDVEDMPGFGISDEMIVQSTAIKVEREEPAARASEPSASVKGAGLPKSTVASPEPEQQPADAGELAPNWDDDATAWNTFLNSCKEKLSVTSKSVSEALERFEPLVLGDWHKSRGWALAAVIAYAKDYNREAISNATMFIAGTGKASDELNEMTQKIAVAVAEPTAV